MGDLGEGLCEPEKERQEKQEQFLITGPFPQNHFAEGHMILPPSKLLTKTYLSAAGKSLIFPILYYPIHRTPDVLFPSPLFFERDICT